MSLLTDDEKKCLYHLGRAWNIFVDLPVLHPDDKSEFVRAMHQLEDKVRSRPVHREADSKRASD
jgi:hypothetical protein